MKNIVPGFIHREATSKFKKDREKILQGFETLAELNNETYKTKVLNENNEEILTNYKNKKSLQNRDFFHILTCYSSDFTYLEDSAYTFHRSHSDHMLFVAEFQIDPAK